MVTVIIPVLNESKTIANVVHFALSQTKVSEVIVVDDGSIDDTRELAEGAGAKVITSSLLGKGASLSDGLEIAQNEIVVFLDGDMSGFIPDLIDRLTSPIRNNRGNFVKAKFARDGGRVTTLTAKPLIKVFFPELSHIDQPLGGIVAARKSVLAKIELETDYGVDLGMLIDLQMIGERIAEVEVGSIKHDSQPLASLSQMASQVTRTILRRASKHRRLQVEQLMEIEENERRSNLELTLFRSPTLRPKKIALFDMDGTLIDGRFIIELSKATGKTRELEKYLDNREMHPIDRTRAIASIFRGVSMVTFIAVARSVPLHEGAVETVRDLRKMGYQVGIISDSFRVATETIRRRVFADFSLAHVMRFEQGLASGEIGLCPSMFHESGCDKHYLCKKNVLLHLSHLTEVDLERFIAIGDGENDICMLETAGTSFAFRPKSDAVRMSATFAIESQLSEVSGRLFSRLNDPMPISDWKNRIPCFGLGNPCG